MKRWWIAPLIVLPVAGIMVTWSWQHGTASLESPYRYRFTRSPSDNTMVTLQREIAFYQERIQKHPQEGLDSAYLAKAYLQMARATRNDHWYLLAEQSARRSLANLPFGNDGAMLVLAQVANAKHDFPEAIRLAQEVRRSQSGNQDALSILVSANLAMGKVDVAKEFADRLVGRIPSLNSLTLRALVHVALGEDEAAIADFQQALAAEEPKELGSSAWARALLGEFYADRGKHQLARQLYQEALRILPEYSLALVHLAELSTRRGKYREAADYYERVLGKSQSENVLDHVALQGIAQVKSLQGDRAEAVALWEKAEGLFRDRQTLSDFGHRRELALLLLQRGHEDDLAEALSLMQAEVEVRRDAETLDILAWALSSLGRWQEAKEVAQEALGHGLRDAGIFYRAGMIEQALGNPDRAIAYFQLAQSTDPTFEEPSPHSPSP